MILVVGATGLLGGAITRRLLQEGREVRILVREDTPAEALATQYRATAPSALTAAGAEAVFGDLRDPGALRDAVHGVSTVITTATTTAREDAGTLESVDLNGTLALIDAAEAAGVEHFIYTSALGAAPQHPHPLFAIKGRIEERLARGTMDYTVLKPGIFMEGWIGMVVGIPLQLGQPVTLVGEANNRHAFIAIDDVADYAVTVVDHPAARNRVLELSGPRSYTWREVAETARESLNGGLEIHYVPVDAPLPHLPPGVDDIFRSMESFETAVDMADTSETFGIEPTPLEPVLARLFAPRPG